MVTKAEPPAYIISRDEHLARRQPRADDENAKKPWVVENRRKNSSSEDLYTDFGTIRLPNDDTLDGIQVIEVTMKNYSRQRQLGFRRLTAFVNSFLERKK